jgi:FkbM family methyltransferase
MAETHAPAPAVTACTIVARNYLPAARVLARSYLRHHPEGDFVIAVIDADEADLGGQDGFRVVGRDAFGIDEDTYLRMATAYSITELATSVKPYLLRQLLRDRQVAIYLDPDIQVFAPMPELAVLAAEHGIVLTPHFLAPLPQDGMEPDDAVIMGTGIFNLGFVAVGTGAGDFLDFWAQRLRHDAIVAPEKQLFTDQRWVDQVPALFGHHVLRDPGFNVAYWNLHDRSVGRDAEGTLTAGGRRLRFFHFSGYRPETNWLLSFHLARKPRILLSEHPEVRALCDAYGAALKAAGYAETLDAVAYGFAKFGDGQSLTPISRRLFRDGWIKAELTKKPLPPHAFGADGGAALRAWLLSSDEDAHAAAGLNRLVMAVWEARVDLQLAFPQPTGADSARLRSWCGLSGVSEGMLPEWAVPAEPEPPAAPDEEFGVNLLGYLTAELGVGEMGRIVHDAISLAKVPVVSVLEERSLQSRTGIDQPETVGKPHFPVSVLAVNADQTAAVLANHPEVGYQRYRIGLWAWELEDFPQAQHHAFDLLDEVWTVSDFCRDALARHTTIPVKTIPVPVRDHGAVNAPRRAAGEPAQFLFAFDFNSTAQRKNPGGVVAAFQRAFPEREDVRLVIKTINARLHPGVAERLRIEVADDPRIELIERYLSVAELHELYDTSTCYVSLHRSEGFGLTVAEAMVRAMPVISTDYSSTREFLDERTGWPIRYRMVPVGNGALPYHPDGVWADPDVGAAAAAMRQIVEDPEEATRRGKAAREHILRTRSMETAAAWMHAELSQAYETWQAKRGALAAPPAPEQLDHPLSPMHNAREALRWRPEPGASSRVPLAPAMRKAVLRVIDHYDVHQRNVMGALQDGVESTAQRLLGRLEAVEAALEESRRAAQRDAEFTTRLSAKLATTQSALDELRHQAPGTQSTLQGVAEDVTRLQTELTSGFEASQSLSHSMFQERDARLDNNEHLIRRITADVEAVHEAARLVHSPVPDGAEVVLCDAGALLLPADDVVLPWIRYHRSWEKSEATKMTELASRRPGAFLDVGAHVGYHTLSLLRTTPGVTRVVAVEVDATNAGFLRRNLAANLPAWQAERVTVVEAAAWDTDAGVRLVRAAETNSGDHRVREAAEGDGTDVVPSVRLETLPEVTAQPVTLVKVDLQGRDHRALAGLRAILERDRPDVVCEFSPEAIEELGDDPSQVLAGYRKLGYRLLTIEADGRVVDDYTDDELIRGARTDEREFFTLWLCPA